MTRTKFFIIQPISTSFIPFLLGSICYALKRFYLNRFKEVSFHEVSEMSPEMARPQGHKMSSEGLGIDLLSAISQFCFGTYTNLFAFMLLMLLIDFIFMRIISKWTEGSRSSKLPSNGSILSETEKESSKSRRFFSKNQIMRSIFFILIFAMIQIVGLCCSLAYPSETLSVHHPPVIKENFQEDEEIISNPMMMMNKDTFRILEEEETSILQSPSKASDKISLSMGNVLSSLNIAVAAMVLSKDKKIAFVTLDFYGTLKIIDISDLQTPLIVSSLSLKTSGYEYRIKSLTLSSDEKTLYVSNFRDLEIIDVSYIGSPRLISLTASEDKMSLKISKNFKTSLALDEKTTTLFIGGLGLQSYDVSNPDNPILLKAEVNESEDEFLRNDICLSHDGQFLLVANGALDVYNISNPKEGIQLVTSLQTKSLPRSIFLQQGTKVALLIGTSEKDFRIILEEVDISDPKSPIVLNTHNLDHKSTENPRILAVSPSKNKIFIFTDEDYDGYDLLIYDLQKKSAIKNTKSLMDNTQTMTFSDNGKFIITGSNGQFMIVELFFNYPNKEIFSGSPLEVISGFSRPSLIIHMKLSSDGNLLYLIRSDRKYHSFDSIGIFEIFDMKDIKEPKLLGSFTGYEVLNSMYFQKNENTVYLIGQNSLSVVDISNKSFPILKRSHYLESSLRQGFLQIVTTSDEKTGIIAKYRSGAGFLTILDLSDPSEIKEAFTWVRNFTEYNCKLLLLDDQTLLVIDKELLFFDISNLQFPKLIALVPLGLNELDAKVRSFVLSPDNKTLFVETFDANEFIKLITFDISDIKSPQLVTEKSLSKYSKKSFKPGFSLTPDLQTGYVFQENSLVKLNLRDFRVSGIIPLNQNLNEEISNYILSPDGQRVYVAVGSGNIQIMNMNIKYSLYLKQEKFRLGEKYSDNIAMLNLNDGSDYDLMNTNAYKVIKLSILCLKIAPNKYSLETATSLLPSWITFDKESNILAMEPKKQRDLGTYIFHSRFSLKIPDTIFDDLGVNSEDLLAWLISLDFVDNQLYLTGNFGAIGTFYLPANFSEYKTQIYNTLKKFYVETSTGFEIIPSLEVKSNENNLMISTLSFSNIRVEIKLEPRNGSEAKFINKPYGSLLLSIKDVYKTQMSFEGELKDINAALGSIVVNFEHGESCNALLTVIDGLNPAVTVNLTNISRYFKHNKAPFENRESGKTVQEQINQAGIETGKYFTFSLLEETFTDDYSENLSYEITMIKNDTAIPSWLSLSGLTLRGTPPEEIFGRDIDLILIAKNEFKESRVPFKLHIRVSIVFVLKLMLRYSPYVLTLLGLIVSANKIFNIVGKRLYKHPKEFFVEIGEEVGNGIFPVTFVKEENIASKLIMKQMMKKIIRQELPGYFVDQESQVLNREMIIREIQEAIMEMPGDQRKIINADRKVLIEQIIINKFINMQLNSKQEMKTKELFEGLLKTNKCLEVVEIDPSSGQFVINPRKFNNLMEKNFKNTENLNESLIHSQDLNANLLKEAILAFAFESHSLDILAVNVNISVKEVLKSRIRSSLSFFKLNLREIFFNENNKIDYGINYRILDDQLCFYGVAERNLKDKTLVVQISSRRHKILKEIWIYGVARDNDDGERSVLQDELEALGQEYEIF